jgi:hypothetical protein
MRELSPMVTQASKPKTAPLEAQRSAPAEPSAPLTTSADISAASSSLRDLLVDEDDEDINEPVPPVTAPPPASDGRMPGDLPRYSLDEEVQVVKKKAGLLGRTKTEFVPVPEFDLAGAIESYLQHKLKHLPDYQGRSIHVHPSPDGGVTIEVDGQYFDAVGDVTDDKVRALLSQTIQEWQTRNTGG